MDFDDGRIAAFIEVAEDYSNQVGKSPIECACGRNHPPRRFHSSAPTQKVEGLVDYNVAIYFSWLIANATVFTYFEKWGADTWL